MEYSIEIEEIQYATQWNFINDWKIFVHTFQLNFNAWTRSIECVLVLRRRCSGGKERLINFGNSDFVSFINFVHSGVSHKLHDALHECTLELERRQFIGIVVAIRFVVHKHIRIETISRLHTVSAFIHQNKCEWLNGCSIFCSVFLFFFISWKYCHQHTFGTILN